MNKNIHLIENQDSVLAAQQLGTTPAMVSRDEMNLAEFPLTVLSTRVDSKLKTLEFRDVITGKNGKPIAREWIITGADKFGLPTASDDEVLLGLLKLTVNEAFKSQKVFFTRYELLQILRWTTEGRSYSRLQKALDRLSGVRIKATNAFYDNESKSHSTKNFGIIDAYEINDGRDNASKKSFFIWSSEIFKSFQVGFIKKLDLEFYQNLTSAIAKRLYRYLDKRFWYSSKVTINLFTLAHEKIGVSRNYQYASSVRQQIDPALDELKLAGFISHYEYQGKGKGTEVVITAINRKPRSLEANSTARKFEESFEPKIVTGKEVLANTAERVKEQFIERGIARSQAEKIVLLAGEQRLQRLQDIIAHFDGILKNQPQSLKNPAGFLYRAALEPEKFNLPGDQLQSQKIAQEKISKDLEERKILDARKKIKIQELQDRYYQERENELDKLLSDLEPNLKAKLEAEVLLTLNKLSGVISAERLQQAAEHALREKVASLFVLPSFEEWRKSCKI